MTTKPGLMLLLSGPSGSGKTSICKRLLEDPRVTFSISATTRPPREGEVDGRDYHFVTPEYFREQIRLGNFIEHAEVYGNMYGTLRAPMEEAIARGVMQLLDDRDSRAELVEAGRKRAARFTWSRAAEETVSVYRSALEPAGSRR